MISRDTPHPASTLAITAACVLVCVLIGIEITSQAGPDPLGGHLCYLIAGLVALAGVWEAWRHRVRRNRRTGRKALDRPAPIGVLPQDGK